MTTKELHTGTNGSGDTIWMVVTVDPAGAWKWIERFDTKAEARNWMRWA